MSAWDYVVRVAQIAAPVAVAVAPVASAVPVVGPVVGTMAAAASAIAAVDDVAKNHGEGVVKAVADAGGTIAKWHVWAHNIIFRK